MSTITPVMRLLALSVILLPSGCGREPTSQVPTPEQSKESPRVEVGIGGPDDDSQRRLPFTITAVYERQTPSSDAPFHNQGGEWTFFDCRSEADSKTAFTIGVMSKRNDSGGPSAWGRAVISVKDRETGGRFVELFGKSFPGTVPKPVMQPPVLRPLFINTAILGQDVDREHGFSGVGGGWTATKWFPEHDGYSGEVYFNYNIRKRQGEFAEKDADYADDLVAVFASALRDGPRPERTPENDPNLSRIGPTIGQPRKLLSRIAAHYSFAPHDRFVVYQNGSTIFALPIGNPAGAASEIIHFDYSPWAVHVLSEDLDMLVQEGVQEMPGVKSSGDPMRIWWVDHKNMEKKLLRGPEKDLDLAESPVSPDNRYVALQQWRDNPKGKGRTKLLYLLDRKSGEAQTFQLQDKDLCCVGWKKSDVGLQAVVVTDRWQLDKREVSELYLADPSSGTFERQANVDARYDIDNRLSPDGKHRVRVGKAEVIVTDIADGKERHFVFHEDDRRFVGQECIEWASPRYLKFNGPRLALIDVMTMKMCFPKSVDKVNVGSYSYKFSSDFRWVLCQGEGSDGEGLFLAPVEMPKEQ